MPLNADRNRWAAPTERMPFIARSRWRVAMCRLRGSDPAGDVPPHDSRVDGQAIRLCRGSCDASRLRALGADGHPRASAAVVIVGFEPPRQIQSAPGGIAAWQTWSEKGLVLLAGLDGEYEIRRCAGDRG